jgi:hypothetical protein
MTYDENRDAYRLAFDPECTIWTRFGELRVGDRIDYWGAARPVIRHDVYRDGEPARVSIQVQGPHGQDAALAPDYEGTWRAPRADDESPDGLQLVADEAGHRVYEPKGETA